MKEKENKPVFNAQNAPSYDSERAKLEPLKDALHLCTQMILSTLADNANILCVGVGTGSELIYLARAHPEWRFTAVEPASAMMKICRQRAEEAGYASRCTFHEGYLDSLPDTDLFDAATSILVSHFFVDAEKRRQYFSEIATRLHPGAYLVNADLASDMSSSQYQSLLSIWIDMHKYAGMPVNVDSFGRNVAMLPTDNIESIIKSGGLDSPVLFFQSLFIHAWFSKRSA